MFKLSTLIAVFAFSSLANAHDPNVQHVASKKIKAEAKHYDPVVKKLHGWTVHIDPKLVEGEHAELGKRCISMLANHLERLAIYVKGKQLEDLRKVEFWVEHNNPGLRGAQYHPSKKWLASNGHDPRLAKKVHFPQAANLVNRGQILKHPAVVLHELAHGYHDQILGFDEPRILKAYQKAMKEKLYDKVMLYTGKKVKAYAATDHKEYFAEATEAYFYKNDFYPFVRGELMEHDPHFYKIVQEIWDK